jgi:hypothetical protein
MNGVSVAHPAIVWITARRKTSEHKSSISRMKRCPEMMSTRAILSEFLLENHPTAFRGLPQRGSLVL